MEELRRERERTKLSEGHFCDRALSLASEYLPLDAGSQVFSRGKG